MDTNKIRTLIRIFIGSVLFSIITTPLMMIGVEYASIINCVIFQSFTVIMISRFNHKIKPWQLLSTILVGGSMIDVSIRLFYFMDTLVSLPAYLSILFATITGYLVSKLIV